MSSGDFDAFIGDCSVGIFYIYKICIVLLSVMIEGRNDVKGSNSLSICPNHSCLSLIAHHMGEGSRSGMGDIIEMYSSHWLSSCAELLRQETETKKYLDLYWPPSRKTDLACNYLSLNKFSTHAIRPRWIRSQHR